MSFTFSDYANRSSADAKVLVEIDIGRFNTQWVNNGAGIWAVDALNEYEWVDADLVEEGFSAQGFGYIGSVQSDGILLTEQATLLGITNNPQTWFYDSNSRMLYVCLSNHDDPRMHIITIGVINAYSYDGTPPGASYPFQPRLLDVPAISIAQDPLYYGLMSYGGGAIRLANADGEFDTLESNYEIYGNPARVFIGFADLDYSDYEQIYTGFIELFQIDRGEAIFTVADKRKQLTRTVKQEMSAQSPISMIKQFFLDVYSISYDSTNFDTSSFSVADSASNQFDCEIPAAIETRKYQTKRPMIEYLEQLCASGFILMWVTPEGKYAATVVDHDATSAETIIQKSDIINDWKIIYDPTEVVSSIDVGHSLNFTSTETNYLRYQDTTRETSTFTAYKTYKEATIDTLLQNTAKSILFSTKFLSIHSVIHGALEVVVPVKYRDKHVGQVVYAELERESGSMLGTTLAWITSKTWNISESPTITFGLRIV